LLHECVRFGKLIQEKLQANRTIIGELFVYFMTPLLINTIKDRNTICLVIYSRFYMR